MKKLIPLVAILCMVSSCTVNEYYECPESHLVSETFYIDTRAENWQIYDQPDGLYYFSTWQAPEITQAVLQEGFLSVFCIENGRDNQLPYIRPYIDNEQYLYTENIRYDVEQGYITFIVEPSDFYNMYNPGNKQFKVVVVKPIYH
jgi:hypothetical protein